MKRDLRTGAIGTLVGMLAMVVMGQAPMSIRPDGIQFTDGTLLTTADTRQEFYLSADSHVIGSTALGTCGDGFHMASLLEILDISNLRYAVERGDAVTRDDSSQGPPTGVFGWIRTGNTSSFLDVEGQGNCNAWTSSDSGHFGTLAELEDVWDGTEGPRVGWQGPWDPHPANCSTNHRIWCVEDSGPPPLL